MVDTYGLPTTLPHQLGFPPPPNFNLPPPSTSAAPDPSSSSSASTLPPPSLNKARIPAFASSRPSTETGGRVPDLQGWTGQAGGGGAPSYQPHSGSSAQAGVSSFAPQVAAFSAGAGGSGGALTGPPTANKNIPAFGAAPPSATAAASLPPIQRAAPAPAPASDAAPATEAPKAKKPRRKSRLLDILAEPSGDNNDEDAALPSFAADPPSRSPSPSPPPQAPSRAAAASSSSFGGGFQTASQRSPFLPLHPPAKSTTTAAAHTDAAQMLCHLAAQPSHSPSPSSSSAPAPIPSLIPQGNPFASQYASSSQLPQPPPSVLQQQQQQQLASPPESNGSGSGSGSGDAHEGATNKGGKELKQTKRAAQNRAAQRAFRERKQQQIRDLEELASRLPNLERDLLFARQLIAQLQAEKMAWEREREALRGEVGALRGMIGVGAAGQGGVVGQVQGGGGEKRPREDGGAVVEGGMAEGEAAKRAREGEL